MRWPVDAPRIRASSDNNTFGNVRTGADGKPRCHQGWDFSAQVGTPCYAICAGTVHKVENRGDYGLQLTLKLDAPKAGAGFAFYAHLDRADVKAGDRVTEGQILGACGNTGNAVNLQDSADHLHFEARVIAGPGKGLSGRISPLKWFGVCPLHETLDGSATVA